MRIQIIFYNNPDYYPPIINGLRILAEEGITADILCRDYDQPMDIIYPPGTKITRITARFSNSWFVYLNFIAKSFFLALKNPSLVFAHDMHAVLPARLVATFRRVPLVYQCHEYIERDRKMAWGGRIARWFESLLVPHADLVISPDRERTEVMIKELGLSVSPLVVANAPLKEMFSPEDPAEGLRLALETQGKDLTRIVFRQGRIGPGHAIKSTLRSMPHWDDPGWGFVIMGAEESTYLDEVRDLAEQLGVSDRFAALPSIPYDQLPEFTSGADIGHALYEPTHAINTYYTTASNKLMEYMASGLPLLVSDRVGPRGFVESRDCGLAADEGSPESIAEAVNALLGDPDRLKMKGDNARQAFEDEFCYRKQFAPVIEVFRELMGGTR